MNFVLEFELNQEDHRPTYLRLAEAIVSAIRLGRIKPGDELPSTRELCKQLPVSRGTIRKTYQIPFEKGCIGARPGSGTFVTEKTPMFLHLRDLTHSRTSAESSRKTS
jgi:DNA-binding GntR family transcriptional regulator